MSRPTLLVPGNLVLPEGDPEAQAVPIEYIIAKLRRLMPELGGRPSTAYSDRVFIIRSETGSGKSTVLPAHIFRLLRSERAGSDIKLSSAGVVCTQPRVLTAQTLARDQDASSAYPDLTLGITVGYQTGPMDEKPARGLVYATVGSVLAQFRTLPDADIILRYRFIIVDEAHERSHETDALLMRLKAFMQRNAKNARLPFLILTSATIQTQKYADFFEVQPENTIVVRGRAFGVETHWPAIGTNNYPAEAVRLVQEIHEKNGKDVPEKSDILIFLPGKGEIVRVAGMLERLNGVYKKPGAAVGPFLVLTLTSEVISADGRDYRLVKAPPAALPAVRGEGGEALRPLRRVILSTVVAETGVTIETLKYVIDSGWNRSEEMYFPGRFRGLITRPVSRSRIEQRKGRAGRKFPGEFYPMYTKNVFDSLPSDQLPAIVTEGINPIFLDIIKASTNDGAAPLRLENISMLDAPPADAIAASMEEAIVFGFLRPVREGGVVTGHALTPLGQIASRFTYLQMPHIETILAGYLWGASIRDLVLIVALYDMRETSLYARPSPGASPDVNRLKALETGVPTFFAGPDGALRTKLFMSDDFLEALLVFEGFTRALDAANGDLVKVMAWCDQHGIDFAGASLLAATRDAVFGEIIAAGLNPFWGEANRLADAAVEDFFDAVVRLKHCIYAGLQFYRVDFDPASREYRSVSGDAVTPPAASAKLLERVRELGFEGAAERIAFPQKFVTNTIRLRAAKAESREKNIPPLLYRIQPGMVSVLDGYVGPDATFMSVRQTSGPL